MCYRLDINYEGQTDLIVCKFYLSLTSLSIPRDLRNFCPKFGRIADVIRYDDRQ